MHEIMKVGAILSKKLNIKITIKKNFLEFLETARQKQEKALSEKPQKIALSLNTKSD